MTIAVIPSLTFTRDAFQEAGPEVVELVLRDVPLQAVEVEVWRAVKEWADGFFDDLSDPDLSPTCTSLAEDAHPVVPEALKTILQFIDLECISWKDVVEVQSPYRVLFATAILMPYCRLLAGPADHRPFLHHPEGRHARASTLIRGCVCRRSCRSSCLSRRGSCKPSGCKQSRERACCHHGRAHGAGARLKTSAAPSSSSPCLCALVM
jgi:hypothetical protein